MALRLVACAQNGLDVSLSSLNSPVPPPRFVRHFKKKNNKQKTVINSLTLSTLSYKLRRFSVLYSLSSLGDFSAVEK